MIVRAGSGDRVYDPGRLVDQRWLSGQATAPVQLICDIDKTYLETEIHGFWSLARTALESAKAKQTVAGATTVLHTVRWSRTRAGLAPVPLHFVSASPPQMRDVLTTKLLADGLDWSSDTFKNQGYNLRRRRFDLLRNQVLYKSLAMAKILARVAPERTWVLLGDDAEADPLIYLCFALWVQGDLSLDAYFELLAAAGTETEALAAARSHFEHVALPHRVSHILIRRVTSRFSPPPPPGLPYVRTENYFEVAAPLFVAGLLSAAELSAVAMRFHNRHGFTRQALALSLRRALTQPYPCRDVMELSWLRPFITADGVLQPLARPRPAPSGPWSLRDRAAMRRWVQDFSQPAGAVTQSRRLPEDPGEGGLR